MGAGAGGAAACGAGAGGALAAASAGAVVPALAVARGLRTRFSAAMSPESVLFSDKRGFLAKRRASAVCGRGWGQSVSGPGRFHDRGIKNRGTSEGCGVETRAGQDGN